MTNFLIVRTDRIGDLLLTTPVASALRKAFPNSKISWLVRPYTAPLLERNPDVDGVLLDRGQQLSQLILELKSHRFDAAIVAYPRWRIAWALWRAGIPVRIGPASKWYSVFFNRRVWQHRSTGKEHEADYNVKLLAPLGVKFERFPTTLVISDEERSEAKKLLASHRITFANPVVILHPGSGGSSDRWPLRHFMELGDRLALAGCDVVVTGGPGENYQNLMIDQMHRIPVFIAAGSVNLRELAAIFACGDLVVTNSTGPLHLAVALNVPTVSIYSPLVTCHPDRWGPYPYWVTDSGSHDVAVAPHVDDGKRVDMGAVSVEEVGKLCERRLAEKASRLRAGSV